jgi:hypothetical protein
MPAAVVPLHEPGHTIASAVDAFLTQADLADATRREYGKHLGRLAGRLGADRRLATVTAGELEDAVTDLWGATKPRTWNQRLAVVGSFLAFTRRRGWPMASADDLTLNLKRRRVKVDRTRVPTPAELERFWAKQNVPLVVRSSPGCSTRPPPAPPSCWRPTSLTSTWTTAACGSPPKAATSSGSTSSPARHGISPGCCAVAPAGRCSSPACGPAPPARLPPPTSAPLLGWSGSAIGAGCGSSAGTG